MKNFSLIIAAALASGLSIAATAQPASAEVAHAGNAPAATVQGAPVTAIQHRHRHHRHHHVRHHRRHLHGHFRTIPAGRVEQQREVRRGNTPDLYNKAGTQTQTGIGANRHQKSGD